jgi:hypothetical protein
MGGFGFLARVGSAWLLPGARLLSMLGSLRLWASLRLLAGCLGFLSFIEN